MKRKLLPLLLSLTCAFGATGFTACDDEENNAPSSSSTTSSAEETSSGNEQSSDDNAGGQQTPSTPSSTAGLAYTLSEDGTYYLVTGIGTATDRNIVIADTYNNLPVKAVGAMAFLDMENTISLTDVFIPDSVTTIEMGAFAYCSALTNIVIPDSVTTIGEGAFTCSALTNITIPDSVTTIEEGAFEGCTALTNITISNNITTIEEFVFQDCPIQQATIPTSAISSLPKTDLMLNSILTEVVITGGERIKDKAFLGFSALASVTISDSVTSIGAQAFAYCDDLTSITIPNNVTTIGSNAFQACLSLMSATFENKDRWSAGNTAISSTDLTNTATAAKYLRSTYCALGWTRADI